MRFQLRAPMVAATAVASFGLDGEREGLALGEEFRGDRGDESGFWIGLWGWLGLFDFVFRPCLLGLLGDGLLRLCRRIYRVLL